MKEYKIIRELIQAASKLEKDTDYFELGGDGDEGEIIIEFLSQVLKNKEKQGFELIWKKI